MKKLFEDICSKTQIPNHTLTQLLKKEKQRLMIFNPNLKCIRNFQVLESSNQRLEIHEIIPILLLIIN